MIRLKPCHFCGCRAIELEATTDGDNRIGCAHVECPACLARGPQESVLQNAIDFWNEAEIAADTTHDATGEKL